MQIWACFSSNIGTFLPNTQKRMEQNTIMVCDMCSIIHPRVSITSWILIFVLEKNEVALCVMKGYKSFTKEERYFTKGYLFKSVHISFSSKFTERIRLWSRYFATYCAKTWSSQKLQLFSNNDFHTEYQTCNVICSFSMWKHFHVTQYNTECSKQ